jgi:hypothetical protein
MSDIKDVNFQDNDLPDLRFPADWTKETREWKGKKFTVWVPKDRVNYPIIDDEGYPYEGPLADTDQVERDLIGDDEDELTPEEKATRLKQLEEIEDL